MVSKSQEFLDFALRQFAREFIKNRTADIIRQDLQNEKKLLQSLQAQVLNEPSAGVFMMLVAFNTYGRIQDMARRRVSYKNAGGREMLNWLEEWIERKGLEKFKRGKYAEQFRGRSDERIKTMIAWGIVKNLKKRGKKKKRGWYNTGKEKDLNNFLDYLLRGYTEAVQAELKNKMEQA